MPTPPRKMKIPPALVAEFTAHVRHPGPGGNGTITADMAAFKEAITATLSNPAFMERLVNTAMKQAQVKMR